jgi:hypothetical protein
VSFLVRVIPEKRVWLYRKAPRRLSPIEFAKAKRAPLNAELHAGDVIFVFDDDSDESGYNNVLTKHGIGFVSWGVLKAHCEPVE